MREIKFCGKRKDNGEWIYGNLVILGNKYFICEKDTSIINTYFEHCFKEVIPETVGQYTGLKDGTKWEELTKEEQEKWLKSGKTKKEWNGKEIFKDDIIEDEYGNYLIVKWNKIFGCWEFSGVKLSDYGDTDFWFKKVKVIGNIHDNPELLK